MPRHHRTLPTCLLLLAGLPATAALAGNGSSFETLTGSDLPTEAAAFIPAGMRPIIYERADLNGDGREDALLVLEAREARDVDGLEQHVRPLLVLTRALDGTLRQHARNDRLALCPECGGIMGDPLQDVTVERKAFSVSHYGGSGWRWSNLYRFAYSRRDDTWQLVSVEESSFHASEPESATETVRLPPRDYGKIDIADFDPETLPHPGKQ